jgi:hypothetical protein
MCKLNSTYRWARDSAGKFIQDLNSPELTYKITNFTNQQFCTDEKSINMAVQEVKNIFDKVDKKADLRKKKRFTEKWFDTECKKMRKELRHLSNQEHRHPRNTDQRMQYFTSLKRYKETIKRKNNTITAKFFIKSKNP